MDDIEQTLYLATREAGESEWIFYSQEDLKDLDGALKRIDEKILEDTEMMEDTLTSRSSSRGDSQSRTEWPELVTRTRDTTPIVPPLDLPVDIPLRPKNMTNTRNKTVPGKVLRRPQMTYDIKLNLLLINCRSLRQKLPSLSDNFTMNDSAVALLT